MSSSKEMRVYNLDFPEFFEIYMNETIEVENDSAALKEACFRFLSLSGLGPKDVQLLYDNDKAFLQITEKAIRVLDDRKERNIREVSAIMIQKTWRGYRTRVSNTSSQSSVESKIMEAFIQLSQEYVSLINSKSVRGSQGQPSVEEIKFMKLLNSPHTTTISKALQDIVNRQPKPDVSEVKNGSNSFKYYVKYSPGIISWIGKVLSEDLSSATSLLDILWDGDRLCRISTILFPTIKCQLISRGMEYTIHKIVFFLEFCRTIGIRANALFSVADLILGPKIDQTYSGVFTVLRTIVALEKQARKKGWNGPMLELKRDTIGQQDNLKNEIESPKDIMSDATFSQQRGQDFDHSDAESTNSYRRMSVTLTGNPGDLSFDSTVKFQQFKSALPVIEQQNLDDEVGIKAEFGGEDTKIALFIESEVSYVERLEELLIVVQEKFHEYEALVFEGEYEDITEIDLLLEVVETMITNHRNFLSRMHQDNHNVSMDFTKLLFEVEKSIFVYVVSIKKLGRFIGLDWLQIPLLRLEEYLESPFARSQMAQSIKRIEFLCEFLASIDFSS